MIRHYDSIATMRLDYIARGCRREHGSVSWYNNESEQETLRKTEQGDTRLVSQAELMLDKLDTQIETTRLTWDRSPAGAFCVVPDVLAGLPTPMRRQIHQLDEKAPITILVTTTSSAGVSNATLTRRGITILALVMALSRLRPVTLQQITMVHGVNDGETILTATINTHPLDLATSCYILTSAGFDRQITHGLARALNQFNGGWPRDFNYFNPEPYYEALIPRLGLDPTHTLLISAAKLNDLLLSDPIKWINNQIAHFTQAQEEETNYV